MRRKAIVLDSRSTNTSHPVEQILCLIDPPLEGFNTVVVSGAKLSHMGHLFEDEVMVFPGNDTFDIVNYNELDTIRGISEPLEYLKRRGYKIVMYF